MYVYIMEYFAALISAALAGPIPLIPRSSWIPAPAMPARPRNRSRSSHQRSTVFGRPRRSGG